VSNVNENAPASVHLASWPKAEEAVINQTMIDEMRLVQKLVSLGRSARETVNIGVRQPLGSAQFVTHNAAEAEVVRRLSSMIAGELNVKQVSVLDNAGDVVEYKLNPLPSLLGRKFGKDFPRVQKTLREGAQDDVRGWADTLLRGENIVLDLEGQTFDMTPEEVEVRRNAAEGYSLAEDNGYIAALDTQLTDELVMEGLAREVVRRVQTLRKDADYNISDNIVLHYSASERMAAAIQRFSDYIRAETLAAQMEQGEPQNGFKRAYFGPDPEGDPKKDTSIDGETLSLAVKRL
jgi:isoleucyl-tRNA synthetase